MTLGGTPTAEFAELRATNAPPSGAGESRTITPPEELVPPTIEEGAKLILRIPGGATVNVVVSVTPFEVAVIVTDVA